MGSLKSLYWNQGLFLKPQHFQQFDLQTSAVANEYSKLRSGLSAGIAKLEIDDDALKNNMLVIECLECILPDGTLLTYPGNCQLEPIKLKAEQADALGHIDVYLGLSPVLEQTSNLTTDTSNIGRYKLSDSVTTKDLFDAHEAAGLTRLDLDCRVLLGEAQLQQHGQLITLKLAELVQTADEYSQDSKFIPQALAVASSKVLQNYIKSLKQSLLGRFEQLESFSSLNNQSGESSSHNLGLVMALNVVAQNVAVFSHFEEMTGSKPEDVYLAIRQLIAQLSVFSRKVSVLGETNNDENSLVAFNQANMSECFTRAMTLATQLLNELTVDPELLITMTPQGEAKYIAAITSEFVDVNNRVYLRLRSSSNLEEQLDDILSYAKLGADGQVDVYLKRSLPGVEMSYLSRKPQGVANVKNSYYFAFNRQSFQWQKVIESNRFGLIWNNAPEDLAIDLIAVKG